ncbi:hypothetical protein FO519_004375 [Halicephalobus sp. NKZ332]|nr:hypothetical protein FO519_004375 [Halicephalobus sp. NKZ332]
MKEDLERITLILHMSFNRVDSSIEKQISNWEGPISLAVVFPSQSPDSAEVLCAVKFLREFQKNDSNAFQKLSVHFLFEKGECSESNFIDEDSINKVKCENPKKQVSDYTRIRQMATYPVNEARNLARNLSSTRYMVIADMDHMFSKNFEAKMISLAQKKLLQDPMTVLVYRIFEIADDVKIFPQTKNDLFSLFNKKKAQEFHKYYGAHSIPKLQEWFKAPENPENNTKIQFYRLYKSRHWEPQFVSLRKIPFHDTSFYYSTRDNTVLRWEMCRAGFKFAIVEDVFMFHVGYKTSKEKGIVKSVANFVKKNALKSLKGFNERMNRLYPATRNTCPDYRL